jgi:hypothetical protein
MKTTFTTDELPQAVIEMYRLRLIEQRVGFLALEFDPTTKKLHIFQYPSCNSWTQGMYRVAHCENWVSWSDLEIGPCGSGSTIQLRKDIWQDFVYGNSLRAKEYNNYLIVSARQFWRYVDLHVLFEYFIEAARGKLDDAITESEKEKEIEV